MYIEQVILDGFKSYATRTVVGPFDTQFNAITGQNGTGKSNILDSICFVLGISQLSKVRVGNLSELVYKSGQAGITKASVTIVLNNEDKLPGRSPVGYESHDRIEVCRQIVIGGRNRYLINNTNVQLQDVQNLFHSVQLNVNNPHFLIMQGTITRVINMKPMEVLSMVEEAAGTKMYENKRHKASTDIERKQGRVREIDRILAEDVTPALDKLRREKEDFVKWSNLAQETTKLERYVIGYEYCLLQELMDPTRLADLQTRVESLTEEAKSLTAEQQDIAKKQAKMTSKSNAEALAPFQKAEKIATTELSTAETLLKHHKKLCESAASKLTRFSKDLIDSQNQLTRKKPESQAALRDAADALAKAAGVDTTLDQIATGQASGIEVAWKKEIDLLNGQLSEIVALEDADTFKLKALEVKLKQATSGSKQAEAEWRQITRERDAINGKISEAKLMIESYNWDETSFQGLSVKVRDVERRMEAVNSATGAAEGELRSRLANFPQPTNSIKGVVAQLFKVKPGYEKFMSALEILAGGRLYNVVVDNDATASELIQRGGNQRRTYLPLNRVDSKPMSQRQVTAAAQIARDLGGEALPAVDILTFAESVTPAMQLVFGGHFVCSTREIASRVCFDNSVRAKTISPDGDSYDPSGRLAGGAFKNSNTGKLLKAIQTKADSQAKLKDLIGELEAISGEQSRMRSVKLKFDEKQLELRSLNRELANAARKLSDNPHQAKVDDANGYAEQVATLQTARNASEARKAQILSEIAALKEKIDSDGTHAGESKEAKIKRDIAKLNSQKKSLVALAKAEQAKADALVNDIASLEDDIKSTMERIQATTAEQNSLAEKIKETRDSLEDLEKSAEEARFALDRAKAEIEAASAELLILAKRSESLKLQREQVDADISKSKSKIVQVQSEGKDAKARCDRLMKEQPWIATEKSKFDYSTVSPQSIPVIKAKLEKDQAEVEALGRKVNKKVIALVDKAERECAELQSKRVNLELEKENIGQFMEHMDDKKGRALAKTQQHVNHAFSSIFKSLLPNVDAKLESCDLSNGERGLELRVKLGEVWKDSLSELSGGQKSLLALSLILALLRFSPAPFYILDEVDAALDVSHTTNIGHMIKTHFPNSQFIIVSLKEGMFSNANVLFKTRFQDGTSMVTRSAMNESSRKRGN